MALIMCCFEPLELPECLDSLFQHECEYQGYPSFVFFYVLFFLILFVRMLWNVKRILFVFKCSTVDDRNSKKNCLNLLKIYGVYVRNRSVTLDTSFYSLFYLCATYFLDQCQISGNSIWFNCFTALKDSYIF